MRSRTVLSCLLVSSTIAAIVLTIPSARADWNPGDPYKMHYPQLPDLTPTGMDVLATRQVPSYGNQYKILADDWRCTESGPVSDIHIWGSWLNDNLPGGTPNNVVFKLSIHSDIPAPAGGFSQPGQELWSRQFQPSQFLARPYASGAVEHFYDPNVNQIIGNDTQVWQYNFKPIVDPFIQQRDTIYWLDVQALPLDTTAYFGWKTTNPHDPATPHFMDDAVFSDTPSFSTEVLLPWRPMSYPDGHPYFPDSIDLAFVITPEPASFALVGVGFGMLTTIRRRSRVA